MTVADILAEWLKGHGYDGLVSGDAECGCEIGDLFPCAGPCDTCEPAFRGPDLVGESDWSMYASYAAAEVAKEAKTQMAKGK